MTRGNTGRGRGRLESSAELGVVFDEHAKMPHSNRQRTENADSGVFGVDVNENAVATLELEVLLVVELFQQRHEVVALLSMLDDDGAGKVAVGDGVFLFIAADHRGWNLGPVHFLHASHQHHRHWNQVKQKLLLFHHVPKCVVAAPVLFSLGIQRRGKR